MHLFEAQLEKITFQSTGTKLFVTFEYLFGNPRCLFHIVFGKFIRQRENFVRNVFWEYKRIVRNYRSLKLLADRLLEFFDSLFEKPPILQPDSRALELICPD